MGGAITYVYRNGQRMTPWMAYQFDRLAAAFLLRFGLVLLVMSAIRTYQEQVDIFLSRYVTAGRVNGRRVYDTRVWNGTRYYRISPLGTVAVPGSSNHEIQGTNAAADFGDSGRDAGVAVAGTDRANWLKANAPAYDFLPEGYNFREPWHYLALNIYATPPAGGGSIAPTPALEEDTLKIIAVNDSVYAISKQYISRLNKAQTVEGEALYGPARNLGRGNAASEAGQKLIANLDLHGVPRDVLDANGFVLNPEANDGEGAFERYGVWSREREQLALDARK